MSEQQKSWNRRMAESLAQQVAGNNVDALEMALEAAGELKSVEVKVMLGRCREVIRGELSSDHEILDQIDEILGVPGAE